MNKSIDNVYLINMDKDKERLKNVTKELDKFNIKFERISGINPKILTNKQKNKYVTNFCQKYCSNGAIGCGLSHFKIYEDVLKKKYNNVIVLEDDIYLTDDFLQILNDVLNELPNDYDILYIGSFGLSDLDQYYDYNILLKLVANNKKIILNKNNIYVPEFPLGTHAYIISNNGCKKILKYLNKINFHIDWQIALNKKYLNIYATNKKIVYQNWENSNNSNMLAFPKYPNMLLNKIYDKNKIPYSYIFNVHIIKIFDINIRLWHIIFFLFGLLNNKYINIILLIYLFIDFDYDYDFIFILLLGILTNLFLNFSYYYYNK
jgi:glycosyl transferase family 25